MTKARSTPTTPDAQPGTPLHYLLAVMNDETADPKRRDRAAVAAAAFMHRRALDAGVKAGRQAEAERVGKNSRLSKSKVPTK